MKGMEIGKLRYKGLLKFFESFRLEMENMESA